LGKSEAGYTPFASSSSWWTYGMIFADSGQRSLAENETVWNQGFRDQWNDIYYPASISTINGTYQQRDNITGTYNFTVDSSGLLRFNFSTGSYNHSLPVFNIKDAFNVSKYKDHIWYRNYSQSNIWQQLTNYTDFVIQEGNSSYFGYNYTLLLINKTLGSDYEFWIDDDSNPPSDIAITMESSRMNSKRQIISRPNVDITIYGNAFYKDLENTAYANQQLTFTYDTRSLGTNTTDSSGNYWFTFSIPYEGSYNLTVSATDSFGNSGENSSSLFISTHPLNVKFNFAYHLGTDKSGDNFTIYENSIADSLVNVTNTSKKYLCSHDSNQVLSLIHSGKDSYLYSSTLNQSYSSNDYLLALTNNIENSQLLLAFTKGTCQNIEDKMYLVESYTLPSNPFSSFAYPIPRYVPILIQFKDDNIVINGTERISKGDHELCMKKTAISSGNKPIVDVSKC